MHSWKIGRAKRMHRYGWSVRDIATTLNESYASITKAIRGEVKEPNRFIQAVETKVIKHRRGYLQGIESLPNDLVRIAMQTDVHHLRRLPRRINKRMQREIELAKRRIMDARPDTE